MTRVSLRQAREVVSRLLWCMNLPPGLENVAMYLTINAQVQSATGLKLLWSDVGEIGAVDVGAVRVVAATDAAVVLDCGKQSVFYVGGIIAEMLRDDVHRHGQCVVVAHQLLHPQLLSGIATMPALDFRLESCVVADLQGVRLLQSGNVGTTDAIGTATLIATKSAGAAGIRETTQDAWKMLASEGVAVDGDLWEAMWAKGLDVLLNQKRRLMTE
jgi:hypothetical protein